MGKGASTEQVVREIRRWTRRRFSAEEKVRIVLEGLRGEQSVAELCRREGLRPTCTTWSRPRRVVAKVEWHPGELYPRIGFIVTNLRRSARRVVAFYNGRGGVLLARHPSLTPAATFGPYAVSAVVAAIVCHPLFALLRRHGQNVKPIRSLGRHILSLAMIGARAPGEAGVAPALSRIATVGFGVRRPAGDRAPDPRLRGCCDSRTGSDGTGRRDGGRGPLRWLAMKRN